MEHTNTGHDPEPDGGSDINTNDNSSIKSDNEAPDTLSAASDDYITSDEDILTTVMSEDQRHHFALGSTLDAEYFAKSLEYALDSVQLDKSLVAQAQLSGHLNNKSQKLADKQAEVEARIAALKKLYTRHVMENRIGGLEKDLVELHARIDALKNGLPKTLLFGRKGTVGIAEKYPVEYNQARDKVLERVSD